MATHRPRNEYEEWKKRKKLADRNLLSKKETAILNKSHFKTNSGAYPRGSSKAFNTRNTVDILLLRQLGARMPGFQTCENAPNLETKYAYGLKNFHTAEEKVLSETEQMKKRPWVDRNHEIQNLQNIYTDGSYLKTQELAGYSVFWGEGHKFNSYGLVPLSGPPSSTSAEEYAILLALLLVKWDNRRDVQYVVRTDARWVKDDILQWVAKWGKPDAKIGWKKRAANPTTDMLKLNAGILWDLRFRGLDVIIQHVPGHKGVSGNEEADEMAKRATHHRENFGFYPVVLPPQTPAITTKGSDLPTPAMECQEFINSNRPSSKGLESIIDWGALAKLKRRQDQTPSPSPQLPTPADLLESDIPQFDPNCSTSLGNASPEMINLVSDTGTSGNSSPDGWDSESDQYNHRKVHGVQPPGQTLGGSSPGEPYRPQARVSLDLPPRENSPITVANDVSSSSHALNTTSRFADSRNSMKSGESQPLPRKSVSVSNPLPAKPRTSKVRFAEPTVSSYRDRTDSSKGSDFIDLCEDDVYEAVKQPSRRSISAPSPTSTEQDSPNSPRISEFLLQRTPENSSLDPAHSLQVEPKVDPRLKRRVERHVDHASKPPVEGRLTAESVNSHNRFSLPPSIAAGFKFFDESGFPTLPSLFPEKRTEGTNDGSSKPHIDEDHEHMGSRSIGAPHAQFFVGEPASDGEAPASDKLPESIPKAVPSAKRNSLPLPVYQSYNLPSSSGQSLGIPQETPKHVKTATALPPAPAPAPALAPSHPNPNPNTVIPTLASQPARELKTQFEHRQVPSIDILKQRAPNRGVPEQCAPRVINGEKATRISPVSRFPTLRSPPPIPSPTSPFSTIDPSSEAKSLSAPSLVTTSTSATLPESTAPPTKAVPPVPSAAAPPAPSVPPALPSLAATSDTKPPKYHSPAPPLVSPSKIIPRKTSQTRAKASLLKPSASKRSNSPPVDAKPKVEPSKIDFSKLKILKRATLEATKQEKLQKQRLDANKMDVDEDVNVDANVNVNVNEQDMGADPAIGRAVQMETPAQQPGEDVNPSLSTPSPELKDGSKDASNKTSKKKSSSVKNALKKTQPTLMFSNLLNQIGSRKSSKDSTSSETNSRENSISKSSTESPTPSADHRDSPKDIKDPEEKLLPAIKLSNEPPILDSGTVPSMSESNNSSRLSSSALPDRGNLPVQDDLDDLEFDEEIDKQIHEDLHKPSIDSPDLMGSSAVASNNTETDAIGIPVSVEQPSVFTKPSSSSRSDLRSKSPELRRRSHFSDSRSGSASPIQPRGHVWSSKPLYNVVHSKKDGPNRVDSRVNKRRSLSKPIPPIVTRRSVSDSRYSLPASALDYGPGQSPGLVSPKDTSQYVDYRQRRPEFNAGPYGQTLEPAPFDEADWKTKDISPVNLGKFSMNSNPRSSPTPESTVLRGSSILQPPNNDADGLTLDFDEDEQPEELK